MKQEEVMVKILSEATNKPVSYWADIIKKFKQANPSARAGFEKVLTQEEADTLMDKLRQEKSGILNWLIEGNVEAHKGVVSRSN